MRIDRKRGFERVTFDTHYPAEDIVLPVRATQGSAGYDFFAPATIVIPSGQTVRMPTDIRARMGKHEFLLLAIRSSLGIRRGIVLPNSIAVIDSDYYGNPANDGNILAALQNISGKDTVIEKGERYMQGIFLPCLFTDNDCVSAVRTGGIGSTEKRGQ